MKTIRSKNLWLVVLAADALPDESKEGEEGEEDDDMYDFELEDMEGDDKEGKDFPEEDAEMEELPDESSGESEENIVADADTPAEPKEGEASTEEKPAGTENPELK